MRERMVTRTVFCTEYSCMVVDAATKQVETLTVSIPSAESLTEKALDAAIRKALPEGKLFVQVTEVRKIETLYGMREAEFIKQAKVLPPRTKAE